MSIIRDFLVWRLYRFHSNYCLSRFDISYEPFLVIRNLMVMRFKLSFVDKMPTLSNSRNLHKSKAATRSHLENKLSGHIPKNDVYDVFLWVFRYAEFISDVNLSISGQGHVKIKMAVQRHLENWTFKLVIIECSVMRRFKVCRIDIGVILSTSSQVKTLDGLLMDNELNMLYNYIQN